MEWARLPVVQWGVLGAVSLMAVVESLRGSRKALWGDLFSEDFD